MSSGASPEFNAASKWHSVDRARVRVSPEGKRLVRVEVKYKKSKGRGPVSVDVDVLDLKRAVTAARDPDLNSDTTIRAADGTLRVQAYSGYIDLKVRSYESDGDARISLEADQIEAMSAFLDAQALGHPPAPVRDEVAGDRPPPTHETHGINWNRPLLRITAEGTSVIVEAEDPADEIPHTETVRVPLRSFAALVEVAGGDLPGHGSFETRRGRLSCDYNRRVPLRLFVATGEVDGATIIVELDIEQIQELRRLVSIWRTAPPSD